MLNRLLQHSKGEADLDLDLVMSTLSANPTSPTSTTGNGNLLVKQSTTANLGSRPDVFAETDRVHI
jgi:hypothetical protein